VRGGGHERRVAARFGLGLGACVVAPGAAEVGAPAAGEVTFLTGPSGSGKTTALRALAARERGGCGRRVIDLGAVRLRGGTSCVGHFPGRSALGAMRALSSAGLADARVFLRPPGAISEGERWRLRLALALDRAGRGSLVVSDEFCVGLDSETARGVSRLVRRAATVRGFGFACASPRDDFAGALGADAVVRFESGGGVRARRGAGRPAGLRVRFGEGTRADYERLAGLHYLNGDPATFERVVTARAGGSLAGVLVASRPTLNGAHRALAWGDRYASGDRRADAGRLNAEVRCLSRVIVDPRFRGQGLARRLVERYLESPLTACTEAIAAMGGVCPFFARAGMTAYALTPSARSARLIDALDHAGLTRESLCDESAVRRAMRSAKRRRFLARELRVWAGASRATGRKKDAGAERLLELARSRLSCERVAYAHTAA